MGGAETKIFTAGKPLEVCQSDEFDQRFDEAFCAAGAAAGFGAGGVRVRRRCEDCHDDQHERRFQPYLAFESEQSDDAGIDDGDGESVDGECSGGWVGAVYGDGDGEFEYERDVERERNGGWIGYGRHDFCERQLYGADDVAKSGFADGHGDERGDEFGQRDERGDDFESDADACGRESGEHRDGQLFDHADGGEFYFGREGVPQWHGADDGVCFLDTAHG
jgi:hypothetical protein